jgi:hypothetical protein
VRPVPCKPLKLFCARSHALRALRYRYVLEIMAALGLRSDARSLPHTPYALRAPLGRARAQFGKDRFSCGYRRNRMTDLTLTRIADAIVELCNAALQGQELDRDEVYALVMSRFPQVSPALIELALPAAADRLRAEAARCFAEADALAESRRLGVVGRKQAER